MNVGKNCVWRERELSSDSKVETISRLAQRKIENFGPCSYRRSDLSKAGIWNWVNYYQEGNQVYHHLDVY
uniref:Uncharacterized protein n=1 Tax=Nelumbo nucifera TaxID=4432 RepID=A0A822XMG0_NELNU|nr:TPA_asm: hypothetical protein HUJ06_022930 [Nelumbo nucifera]